MIMELKLTDEQCLYLIKLMEEKLQEKLEVSSSEESEMIHNLYSKLVVQAGRDNLIK